MLSSEFGIMVISDPRCLFGAWRMSELLYPRCRTSQVSIRVKPNRPASEGPKCTRLFSRSRCLSTRPRDCLPRLLLGLFLGVGPMPGIRDLQGGFETRQAVKRTDELCTAPACCSACLLHFSIRKGRHDQNSGRPPVDDRIGPNVSG